MPAFAKNSQSKKLLNLLWWIVFTAVALAVQVNINMGIDLLVAGLIISLQEKRITQTIWLVAAWVIIQEGMSDLAFGSTILWYVGTTTLFYMCNWLFESRSIMFLILLCIVLGAWHGLLTAMMVSMEDYAIVVNRLAWENLFQSCIILPVWFLAHKLRGALSVGENNGRTIV